jgi:N-carbamoylputrescine amidase
MPEDGGMQLITALEPPLSPARVQAPPGPPTRVGLVQHRWLPDASALREQLAEGIALAAGAGARVVFLPELTLSRYPADLHPDGDAAELAEDVADGPTLAFAREAAAAHQVHVHASLYERAQPDSGEPDGLGYNTAVLVAPDGRLVGRTRKMHIPVTEGYHENEYFRPGPPTDAYAPVQLDELDLRLGMPTCWDQWYPEVARLYALGGAQVLAYPTAIGSEPDHPDFDTEPMWRQVIVGHAIANGLFMVVPNRYGDEGRITFYGSSFICDPYGRILVRAPRDAGAVLVADLDLAQRRDWLDLFPFLPNRRPDSYGGLTEARRP